MALFLGAVILLGLGLLAEAAHAAAVVIPEQSGLYRVALQREAESRFGLNAPVARIAGQTHQESAWRPTAASAYAQGLVQVTPQTAAWLPSVCPDIGAQDPWDAHWSMRAIVCYDHWLLTRVTGATECDRWAFALSGYNGGAAWVAADRRQAAAAGADSSRWFDQVERYSPRSSAAIAENRAYVRRILKLLEPAYIAAGWPGQAVCP